MVMNLSEAQLCIDCEWVYPVASHCPRCGSQVAYPVARAMDRNPAVMSRMAEPPTNGDLLPAVVAARATNGSRSNVAHFPARAARIAVAV
jgi:hypothetical protein